MSQTTVGTVPAAAFEGMVADGDLFARRIVSRLAHQVATPYIPFGKFVVWNSADTVEQVRLPAALADVVGGRMGGIAIAETSIQDDTLVAWGHYINGRMVPVMRKGVIWVISETAITDLNLPVCVRATNAGVTPPLATLGSFRGDVDAQTPDRAVSLGALASWLDLCSAGGLARVAINLP